MVEMSDANFNGEDSLRCSEAPNFELAKINIQNEKKAKRR